MAKDLTAIAPPTAPTSEPAPAIVADPKFDLPLEIHPDRGHALKEAIAGHLAPLIGRIRSGAPLTPEERQLIAGALQQLEGKRGKVEMRRLEKELVRWRVDELVEAGEDVEAAVAKVEDERGRSRSYVYKAARRKESKKSE